MKNQARLVVALAGAPLANSVTAMIERVTITDKAGTSTDVATIVFDDGQGLLQMPPIGSSAKVLLGKPFPAPLFSGTVEKVRSSGGRGGTRLTVTCKGIDVASQVREPQRRHFDDMTVEQIIIAAGSAVGVTDFRIAEIYKTMERDYEAMDSEDFISFSQRLAKEVGATFKFRNDTAVFAVRNSGETPSGQPMPTVLAARGVNLHTWDVAPRSSRPRYRVIEVRYFDQKAGEWKKVTREAEIEGAGVKGIGTFEAPNEKAAEHKADALKAEMERDQGEGTVSMELTPFAQPEGALALIGARLGIDGGYRIDGVTHTYQRSGGSTTNVTVKSKIF